MTKNTIRKKSNIERYTDGWIMPGRKTESYMIESEVRKLFRKWLKNNIDRFNYKPYAVNSMCEEYHFKGITKHITLLMDYRMPEAMMYHHKECYNHDVLAYIGYEKYDTQKGYHDLDGADEVYDYYPTQEALYINEVFEPIIKYVNEKFVKENQLYVNKSECYESSTIAPKADYEKLKENFNGGRFSLRLPCVSDDSTKDEPVMRAYDLFEEIE